MKTYTENQSINSRYSLKKFLGVGVFGEVWSAHDNILNMDVAIKLYTSSDESSISRLQQEYKNAFNLSHENILSPKHFDVTEGCPFMIYNLCKDGSIRKMIGSVEESTVWKIIHDVSQGLQEIHKRSLVHNNLKPENILLNENNSFVISDMALNKSTRATMSKESIDRYRSSIAYKAPEVRSGKTASPQCDVWSLGVIVFELFMGRVPSETEINNIDILLSRKNVSDLMRETLSSCLSFEETSRPTVNQLYDISVKALNGESINKDEKQKVSYSKKTQREGKQSTGHVRRLAPRNWFVTFFEWGLLLSSLLLILIFYGCGFENLSNLRGNVEISDYDVESLYVDEYFLVGFLCSIKLLGEIMLLAKNRVGYIVSSSALFCAAYASMKAGEDFSLQVLISPFCVTALYMLILWLVLLIHKDGYSQWETMLRTVDFSKQKWIVWCALAFVAVFIICEFFTL